MGKKIMINIARMLLLVSLLITGCRTFKKSDDSFFYSLEDAYPGSDNYKGHYQRGQIMRYFGRNTEKKFDGYYLFYFNIYVKINGIWYEGNRICIDIDSNLKKYYHREEKININKYSDKELLINQFVKVFSTYPDVDEVALQINRERKIYKAEKPVSKPSIKWETANVQFFTFSDYDEFEYHTENISFTDLLDETVKYLDKHTGIKVINIYYEGDRLIVDLDPYMAIEMDRGTFAGVILFKEIINTFASYPGVNEIKCLIGGLEDCRADHFNFEGVCKVEAFE